MTQARKAISAVVGTLMATCAFSSAAWADFTVANRAGKSVWVTTYDGFGKGFWTRCLANSEDVTFKAAGAFKVGNTGGLIYIRGELKERADCGGKTLGDTGRGGVHFIPDGGLLATFVVVGGQFKRQI